jgi:hypothetical protein
MKTGWKNGQNKLKVGWKNGQKSKKRCIMGKNVAYYN